MNRYLFLLTSNTSESISKLCKELGNTHPFEHQSMLNSLSTAVIESLTLEVELWQSNYRQVDKLAQPERLFTTETMSMLVDVHTVLVTALELVSRSIESAQNEIRKGSVEIIDMITQLVRVKQWGLKLMLLVDAMLRLYQQTINSSGKVMLPKNTVRDTIKASRSAALPL